MVLCMKNQEVEFLQKESDLVTLYNTIHSDYKWEADTSFFSLIFHKRLGLDLWK